MLAFLVLVISTSCGTAQQPFDNPTLETIATQDRSQFYGQTLTIVVINDFFMRTYARLYERDNPGVTIEVINLWEGDFARTRDRGREIIATQMMAGQAPTLIDSQLIDYFHPQVSANLVNLFEFMDADPTFNSDNYFANVFNAVAVEGRLVSLPIAFEYQIVAANTTIPGLEEALAGYPSVTLSDLINIHSDISDERDFYIDWNFDVHLGARNYIDTFFDFGTRWADFDNQEFVDLINWARDNTNPNMRFGRNALTNIINPAQELEFSERYPFMVYWPYLFQYMLPFEEDHGPLFRGAVPLVNEHEELIITVSSELSLNANTTPLEQALAWDFMRFKLDLPAVDVPGGVAALMQPVARATLDEGLGAAVSREIGYFYSHNFGWSLIGTRQEATPHVLEQVEIFGNMPMASRRYAPFIIENFIRDTLEQFHDGLLTAEQTAAIIQDRVTLMLMEMD